MNQPTITPQEFKLFREFIYEQTGIALAEHKITLVQGRFSKRLRQLGLNSYREYYDYVRSDAGGEEIFQLINAISTNVTHFFREPPHWEIMEERLPEILSRKRDKRLRIWSAASSTGEEPYSIAIFLRDKIKDFSSWDIKILASDISQEVLQKAIAGIYDEKSVRNFPRQMLLHHFDTLKEKDGTKRYVVKDELKKLIMFRMFNLVTGDFSLFKNKFDMIFCRNVMIYFDPPTQQALVSRFAKMLEKKSLLFIGQSEALTRNKDEFQLIRASVYERI